MKELQQALGQQKMAQIIKETGLTKKEFMDLCKASLLAGHHHDHRYITFFRIDEASIKKLQRLGFVNSVVMSESAGYTFASFDMNNEFFDWLMCFVEYCIDVFE